MHTTDCIEVLNHLISSNSAVIKNWCKRNGRDYSEFIRGLRLSMHYHDFGKATDKWQTEIRKDYPRLPNHAAHSGYFLMLDPNSGDLKSQLPFFFAVISHHSLLTDQSWSRLPPPSAFDYGYLNSFNINSGYSTKPLEHPCNPEMFNNYCEWFKELRRKFEENSNRSKWDDSKIINTRFKAEYCLALSLISTSDSLASMFEEKGMDSEERHLFLKKEFPSPEKLFEEMKWLGDGFNLSDIQKQIENLFTSDSEDDFTRPLRIEAPCGEGKTLAALMYAKELFKKGLINRVIFTLPTQTTTNNMVYEFEENYGIPPSWIGVYHSEVMSFLLEQSNEEDSDDNTPVTNIKYWNAFYSRPFNISTIDHLLLSLVNGYKYAPRGFGNLQNSLIIIDEFHYYDKHTIGMIGCLCRVLRHLKIPYILMSATMPKSIKKRFSEGQIAIQSNGISENGEERRPYRFIYHKEKTFSKDKGCSPALLEIIENHPNQNVGIIVNTVNKSKGIYRELQKRYPDHQILLYNAEFMRKDRPIKEKLLRNFGKSVMGELNNQDIKFSRDYGLDPRKGIIFVGTQVAEISLNMSFDVLISDLAPMDALIQRGGRLHRRWNTFIAGRCGCKQCQRLDPMHEYCFHVFDTGEECLPYSSASGDGLIAEIIENTRDEIMKEPIYSFKKGIEMMDNTYSNEEFFSGFEENTNFYEPFREDLIFGKKPFRDEEKGGPLRITTRIIGYQKYDALPYEFLYNDENTSAEGFIEQIYGDNKYTNRNGSLNNRGINEITKYFVKVPNHGNISEYKKDIPGCSMSKHYRIIYKSYQFSSGLNDLENIWT